MSRSEGTVGPTRAHDETGEGHSSTLGFICANCGLIVSARSYGTSHRNHCPHCLWSLHVDVRPGDRAHLCRAPMEPVAIWALQNGERRIIHRCTRCSVLKANRAAGDDSEEALEGLAAKAAATIVAAAVGAKTGKTGQHLGSGQ
jgi:DNA-directed RNA polymerase subunit RPC12/RpoP